MQAVVSSQNNYWISYGVIKFNKRHTNLEKIQLVYFVVF